MSKRTQSSESKTPRTKSWQSLPEYDKSLSNYDYSTLRVLESVHKRDLGSYRNTHDLYDQENQEEYMLMQKQLSMIKQEIFNRGKDASASPSYINRKEYFDPETSCVVDEHGNDLYSINFNEEEDRYIYENSNNQIVYIEDDYEYPEPSTLKEIHLEWRYWEKLDDEE